MDAAFAWLGELMSWLGRWIPRLVIIRPTHRAVLFRRGRHMVKCSPGLRVYWPLVTEIELLPVARQPQNMPTQKLTTLDGVRVLCSVILVFWIRNLKQAVGQNWDYEETVRDLCLTAVAKIVVSHSFDWTHKNLDGRAADILTAECKQRLHKYGITVERCSFTDFCKANVIALAGDFPTVQEMGAE